MYGWALAIGRADDGRTVMTIHDTKTKEILCVQPLECDEEGHREFAEETLNPPNWSLLLDN